MAVAHLDCHSSYFYSPTHLHKTSDTNLSDVICIRPPNYQMLLPSDLKILKKLEVKLEKDTGSHLLPKLTF